MRTHRPLAPGTTGRRRTDTPDGRPARAGSTSNCRPIGVAVRCPEDAVGCTRSASAVSQSGARAARVGVGPSGNSRPAIRAAATCLQSTPTGQLHSPHQRALPASYSAAVTYRRAPLPVTVAPKWPSVRE